MLFATFVKWSDIHTKWKNLHQKWYQISVEYEIGTEPDIEGFIFNKIANTDILQPYSREYEFSNKRGELRNHWRWNWSRINEVMKDNLKTFRTAIEKGYKKFLYYDDSNYYWVKMTKDSLKFERIAYQTYNTSIELYEQLQ